MWRMRSRSMRFSKPRGKKSSSGCLAFPKFRECGERKNDETRSTKTSLPTFSCLVIWIFFVIRRWSFVICLMEPLRSISELSRLRGPIFLAIGVFDGVHLGHKAVISTSTEHARAANGTPVVVTFDPHPEKILRPEAAPHLLTASPHKIALIRELGVAHLLIVTFDKQFAATEPEDFVQQLVKHSNPLRQICVGHQWSFGKNRRGNLELLKKLGAQFDFNVIGIPPVTVT